MADDLLYVSDGNASPTYYFQVTSVGNIVSTGTFTPAGNLVLADSVSLVLGTGSDFSAVHNGTNTVLTSGTGDLIIDNTLATGATYMDLGTDTSATEWGVRNNSGTAILTVLGNSTAVMTGSLQVTGTLNLDAALDLDHALTAAGDAANVAVTINNATADAAAGDFAIAQITTPRTAGVASAVKGRVTSLSGDTAGVNYACFEGFCTVGEANADHSLLYTRDAMDHLVTVAASGDGGVTVSADGMTANPETDAEAGYVSIQVGTTVYQIPIYAA